MNPIKLTLYFLLVLTACQFNTDQSVKTDLVLNLGPILNLIRYDRDGIQRMHLLRPEEIDWIIEKRDSVTIPELGLVAYLFQFKDSLECLKTLETIRQEMAQNKKGVYYFQGELYNGIWRGQIARGYKDKYYIYLDYLNSKCAFTIWF